MKFTLRPYQQEAVDRSVRFMAAGHRRNGIVIAPTGSGKSLLIASVVDRLSEPTIVFQPNKEILEQNRDKLRSYGYEPAVFSASLGEKDTGHITLATIGSAIRHPEVFQHVRHVIVDECHFVNAKAGMYKSFLQSVKGKVLGFTATPYRLASNSLGSELRFLTRTRPRVFTDVIYYTQIRELLDAGYLAPLEYRRALGIDTRQLRLNSTGADYTDRSVKLAYGSAGFESHLIRETKSEISAGRTPVVFTRFVEEAEMLADAVPGVECVSAQTSPRNRARILYEFRAGRIPAVANVGIIALGFDYPELDSVILGRPTLSLAVYYQQVGRVMRPHPSKPAAHVIDMVGVTDTFGHVEDMVLRPGGATGQQWAYFSGRKQLTNTFIESGSSRPSGRPVERKVRIF